jgi:hypothetical protein
MGQHLLLISMHSNAETLLTLVRASMQEDGIFNFSGTNLISHGFLLRNHFAAAMGASHTLGFDANDMAAASLDGPGASRLDDRVFDSAMRAFNELAARPI